MIRLGLRDYDWEQVGAELAVSDSEAQSKFFKGLVKECLTWGTRHQIGMQFASINNKLTYDEREILSQITYQGE